MRRVRHFGTHRRKQYREGSNVVVIEPDVVEFFPDHDSVNEALRNLAAVIRRKEQAEQGHGERRF
ncbi:MAG: hypothetical protein EA427_02365 [Spirochaetaceae bacterium]|nr:MAG: hypothetical protein EA427_02365 [Spirochaetaceae bacterium]